MEVYIANHGSAIIAGLGVFASALPRSLLGFGVPVAKNASLRDDSCAVTARVFHQRFE